tara:strand:+ start:3927 stop:4592 length:666 start_codon:yes stop_codon:yes gene_type:complete
MNNNISVVLLGAGKSNRLKNKNIKQNIIINKKRIIDYSRDFFSKYFSNSKIHLVINKEVIIKKKKKNENIVIGSSSRVKSLFCAMKYIYNNNLQTEYILIHDVARPVLNINNVNRLIYSIKPGIDGSSLGYPLTNAIKEVGSKHIRYSINKENLWSAFTPQIFRSDKLYESLSYILKHNYEVEDDIEALLIKNCSCAMVMSSPDNIKVTYAEDIEVVKRLL